MLQLTSKTRRTIKPHILRTSCLTLISNAHPRPAPLYNFARLYSTEQSDKPNSEKNGADLKDNDFKPAAAGRQRPHSRALRSKSTKKRGGAPQSLTEFLKDLESGKHDVQQSKPAKTKTTETPEGAKTENAQGGTPEAAEGGSKNKKGKAAKKSSPSSSPAAVANDPKLMQRATAVLRKVLEKELRAEQEGAGSAAGKKSKPGKKKKQTATETKPTEPKMLIRRTPSTMSPKHTEVVARVLGAEPTTPAPATKKETKESSAEPKAKSKAKAEVRTPEDLQWPPPGRKLHVRRVDPDRIKMIPVQKEQPPVPGLSYGLDRALFNPGVYHMQDPRSRVWNFDPYLARIMPIQDFDFNALKQYITSSKDTTLIDIAREEGRKYTGSTSSMTSTLAHFHYLLSSWRPITTSMMSQSFRADSTNFTRIMRAPSAAFLHWKDGVYAIDADKEFDTANILSMLGKSMEKLLTLPKEDFEKYRKTKSHQLTEEERDSPESYHYTKLGDFMMRSQLDAYDPRVPGTGMFDLKTRAVISIRMDAKGFQKGLGYEIRNRFGNWESFEREYFDMIRSAFLKYSLQVRMGRMDGIFVAFHNTQRIFGFQYIPLTEMDHALHGTRDTNLGGKEFKLSLHLLNKVLDRATAKWPERSLRLHIETRPTDPPLMYIFAKPVTPEEIEAVQGANKKIIEKFERDMMGLEPKEEKEERLAAEQKASEEAVEEAAKSAPEPREQVTTADVWEDMVDKVEEALENEEHGVTSVREAIEQALRSSGLLEASTPEEARRYLDELLEALTTAESGKADESAADSAAEESESAVSAEESTDAKADATQAAEAEEEPTLSDLVLRLASQVKANRSEVANGEAEDDVSTAAADDSKLNKFETILSELISKSRAGEEQPAASTDSSSPSSSEPLAPEDELASLDEAVVHTSKTSSSNKADKSVLAEETPELLGMILTIRNKVNGEYVERPENLRRTDKWEVEYSLENMPTLRAENIYKQVVQRRRKTLDDQEDRDKAWYEMFQGALDKYTTKGRRHRQKEIALAKTRPVHVYGLDKPLDYESVFGKGNEEGMSYRWYGQDEELAEAAADVETGTIELSAEELEEDDGSLPVPEEAEGAEDGGEEAEVEVAAFAEEKDVSEDTTKSEEKDVSEDKTKSEEKSKEKSE
ncbi:mitochondrial protein Pet127-domain-containing protein [Sordaria brevicollis]|uniref:Mitochondrial protein Pet127-domain-containing protein n=1 Tax=Sordaria brevicollis TaxID=83679 RepID=A0AAE0PNC6_SORBR|nr:mitochondrial protein Pet127-domain-containing protein [Sordaria brevicollis]